VNVPVAVNCWVSPRGTEGIAGVIAIDTSVAAVTKRFVDPEMEPDVAVTVVVPVLLLVASPAVLIGAIAPLEEVQFTEPVRS
jgi:hypothetical protein